MQNDLRTAISTLLETVDRTRSDGVVDPTEQRELDQVVQRVRSLIDDESVDDEDDDLLDYLEDAAARFQNNHPALATMLRSVAAAFS